MEIHHVRRRWRPLGWLLLIVGCLPAAATALAARMGAQILAEKPALWPETVRGLIVHSSEWTPAMRANQGAIGKPALLRRYGFGVPSLARALGSLDHDVTIVAEYGVAIADLANGIRRNVIAAIEKMTGLEVTEVNITVNDVHVEDDTDDQQRDENPRPARVQ